jgi:hypothetical protein
VLLYRQALSLAPIIGDIALELRLRSTLNRLEEQVTLLEQDITEAATTAWAEARERAAQAQQAERAQRDSASQTAGRQRTAVDELFDMGLAAFWRGDLLHARNVLAEVVRHEPAYRTEQHRAANLLAGVERRLALPPPSSQRQASLRRSQSRGKIVAPGGVWRKLAVVALPVIAVLVVLLFAMSPAAPRAQESRSTSTPGVAQVLPSTSDLPAADPAAAVDAFVDANGGVARFGQALSPLLDEAVDGVSLRVRYYERGLVEFSEGAAPEESVGILPLGTLELARRYPQGAPAVASPSGDDLFFEGTGFALSGDFREFWERPGNAGMLGQPVSGMFEEVDATGAVGDVQYFEFGALRRRAVDPPAPVEAAPLGAERYKALHSNP